jgi:hypothetical protein
MTAQTFAIFALVGGLVGLLFHPPGGGGGCLRWRAIGDGGTTMRLRWPVIGAASLLAGCANSYTLGFN